MGCITVIFGNEMGLAIFEGFPFVIVCIVWVGSVTTHDFSVL